MSIFINETEIRAMREHYKGHIENLEKEVERLRSLLQLWVDDADSGMLDGVDLALMVESETILAAEAAGETT